MNISTKKTPRRTKILISPVWNNILKIWDTIFELIQIEVQYSKNYFKSSLPQEAGAYGNNIEKEPQKSSPKLKFCILYIYREYLLCLQSNTNSNFLQICINFVVQRQFSRRPSLFIRPWFHLPAEASVWGCFTK